MLPTEVPVAWGSKFDPFEVGIACPANVSAALDCARGDADGGRREPVSVVAAEEEGRATNQNDDHDCDDNLESRDGPDALG